MVVPLHGTLKFLPAYTGLGGEGSARSCMSEPSVATQSLPQDTVVKRAPAVTPLQAGVVWEAAAFPCALAAGAPYPLGGHPGTANRMLFSSGAEEYAASIPPLALCHKFSFIYSSLSA